MARWAADQEEQDRNRRQIGRGEEQFVNDRAGRKPTEPGENQFHSRGINRAVIAVIDLAPGRELCTQRRQLLVVRRENVRIEAGVLYFPLPLITPKVVARFERERDDPEKDRHAPEDDGRAAAGLELAEVGSSGEERDAAQDRGLDKFYRHRGITPVVEPVQRGEEQDLGEEREPEPGVPNEPHRRSFLC